MPRILSRKPVRLLLTALALGLLWVGFAPIQLGGPVSYIIINGASMEPDFKAGDLVVARRSNLYEPGQRVIYQHPQVGYVFHRIIDQDRGLFILKGDNNNWVDAYQPAPGAILGKYWVDIPGAGNLLLALRQPAYFVLFVMVNVTVIAGLVLIPDRKPGRKTKGRHKMVGKETPSRTGADFRLELLIVFGILALAAVLASLVSFSKDLMISVDDDLLYQHSAQLSYSVPDSDPIYDRAGVETGDPIYPVLNCEVNLHFSYSFSSPRLQKGDLGQYGGTISIWAEIRDYDGWNRRFLLIPDYAFKGTGIQAQPTINICRMLDRIAEKEAKTGLDLKAYSLTILPEIQLAGQLEDVSLEDDFSPEFVFDLSDDVLRMPPDSEGFSIIEEGKIPHKFSINNFIQVLGRQVDVIRARQLSLLLLALCLVGVFYPAWTLFQDWRRSERSRIEIQHRPVIIDLKGEHYQGKDFQVIDLESMADLSKLADRYGALIMHETKGDRHKYYVVDGRDLYQYTFVEGEDLPSGKE